jgi:hypothetical protein
VGTGKSSSLRCSGSSEDQPANKSLEPTLLSRILVRLLLPLQHFKSSLVTLRQPQGGSAPPLARHPVTVYHTRRLASPFVWLYDQQAVARLGGDREDPRLQHNLDSGVRFKALDTCRNRGKCEQMSTPST